MLILALETSSMVSSVAIASEQKLIAELTVQTRLTHSETLMPHIEQVLHLAGIQKEQLEGIAVSIGPGSFTGLRIGLAAAKGMAYALQLPIVGCSTLEALAWHCPIEGIYAGSLVDAQKGNAYAGFYYWQDGLLREKAPVRILSLKDALSYAGELDHPVMLLGDIVQKKIAGHMELPAHVQTAPAHICMPRAANIAMLGIAKLQRGEVGNVMDMEPVYLRRSEAEVLWEARQKKEQA